VPGSRFHVPLVHGSWFVLFVVPGSMFWVPEPGQELPRRSSLRQALLALLRSNSLERPVFCCGTVRARSGGMGFRCIEDIDAWQLARKFKIGVYKLIERDAIARDFELRDQLREAAAGAPSQISEGFGRFDPVDFARFVKMARGSIQECR